MISDLEFLAIVHWRMSDLAAWCRGHSLNHVMELKRDIQQALARYSRKHPMDAVQEKAVAMTRKLEKWCYPVYIRKEMADIVKMNPGMITKPRTVKAMARLAWEDYNKNASY